MHIDKYVRIPCDISIKGDTNIIYNGQFIQ